MEAVWIDAASRDHAQALGYTVVDPSTVIATHLSFVIQSHANEILGHEEVQQLLNGLAKSAPKLVEDLVPRVLPLSTVVRVLQSLLAERIPIRNIRTIIETLAEHAPRSQDAAVLLSHVRVALGSPDRAGHRRHRRGAARHHVRAGSGAAAHRLARRQLHEPRSRAWTGGAAATARRRGIAAPGGRGRSAGAARAAAAASAARRVSCGRRCPSLHVLAWNEIPDNRKVRVVTAVGR